MRRHRRLSRRGANRQRRTIILSILGLFLVFSVGYAAFQTNITINVKGNIKNSTKASFGGIKVPTVTDGDGLYESKDSDNNDIYIYRGANPDNYIMLGEDLYRIMEIDKDGNIKVIKDTPLSNMVWDPGYSTSISGITDASSTAGTRYSSSSSDYCNTPFSASSYYGCKSWGSNTSTLNSAGTSSVTQMPQEAGSNTLYNLPTYDSYMNVYLNGGTYPTSSGTTTLTSWYSSNVASNLQSKIVSHLWNVGPVKYYSLTLAQNIQEEAAYKWSGKVGLMTATDYVRASTNSACTNVYNYYYNSSCYNNSSTHNWLYTNSNQWTMAPNSYTSENQVWFAYSSGALNSVNAYIAGGVRPVLYLDSCTRLTGKGTSANPYGIGADDGSCSSGGGETPPAPTPTQRTAADVVEMMEVTPVTTGDGLYNNGDGTYTYKGANPANYLSFAGSTWRILGIDSTGIKIIRDEKLDTTMAFDTANARTTANNPYCTGPLYGCNVWSKDYTPSGSFNNTGLVNEDSSLKTYLNGDYLTTTLGNDSNIIEAAYNVGPYNNESSYTWTGKVALLTAPEYKAAGGSSSYLKKSYYWWLLSPYASNTNYVYYVSSYGYTNFNNASSFDGVRPVLYLSSNITLTGTGIDSNSAFTIS